MTETPEIRLERMFQRITSSGAITFSASHIASVSGALESRVAQSHRRQRSGLRAMANEWTLPEGYDPDRFVQEASQTLAKQAVVNTETLMSVAVLILGHSTADDIFTEACGPSIELGPGSWRKELNPKRTISLADLAESGQEKIFARELAAYQKNIRQKSLPERADLLFRRVPIHHNPEIAKGDASYFTLAKLKHLDELRHLVVHGDGIPRIDREYSQDAAQFLNEAAFVGFRSVAVAYRIEFDLRRAIQGIQKPPVSDSWTRIRLRANDE
jgi:hypothetical protein